MILACVAGVHVARYIANGPVILRCLVYVGNVWIGVRRRIDKYVDIDVVVVVEAVVMKCYAGSEWCNFSLII